MGSAENRYASGCSKSASAARTAAMTNVEKVQSFPWIAFSTASTTSLGKRMVLFVVGGWTGSESGPLRSPRNTFVLHSVYADSAKKYAMRLQCSSAIMFQGDRNGRILFGLLEQNNGSR